MGAAYDRTGAFLGDVQGDTLAKVREEILLKFPAAARVEAHEVPSPFDELLMWLSEQRNDCDHTTDRWKTLASVSAHIHAMLEERQGNGCGGGR